MPPDRSRFVARVFEIILIHRVVDDALQIAFVVAYLEFLDLVYRSCFPA